jgi:alcohol dehydrogenase class IV
MFSAPHGALCAAVLPHAMKVNLEALGARDPQNPALRRYDEVARLLTGSPHAVARDGVGWVADLCQRLEIPPLRTYGVEPRHVPDLVEAARRTSSMKGNPVSLTSEELSQIVAEAI